MSSGRNFCYLALYEFLGTMIALLCINCSQGHAAVIAIGIFVAATLTGRICGGHFNAAVTLSIYVCERKWRKNLGVALIVIFVDLLGAIAAMVISMLLLGIDGVVKLSPPEGKFGGRT